MTKQTYEVKVEGIQVRDNEHLQSQYKAKFLNEMAALWDLVWIKRPVGDVTYYATLDADDNNDTYAEQAYNKVKSVARTGLEAVTPDKPVATKPAKK